MIDLIANSELGSSVRSKLNEVIGVVNLEYFLTAITTDNTQTELLERMVVPVNKAWAYEILLLSWSGGSGDSGAFAGAWRITGAIYNNDGTVSLAKNWNATSPTFSTLGRFDPAKISGFAGTTTVLAGDTSNTFGAPVVDADTANNALRIRVTATNYSGGAAKEFHWKARVRIVELAGF